MIDLLHQHGQPTKQDRAFVSQGLTTGDVPRFVRFFWECPSDENHWWWYTAGGGYKKWAGNEYLVVEWEDDGRQVKDYVAETYPPEKFTLLIKQPETYGREAIYYGAVARGSLGPRLCKGAIFGDSAPGVMHTKLRPAALAGILSTRLASFLIRALSATVLTIRDPYVVRLPLYNQPLSEEVLDAIESLVVFCSKLKQFLNSMEPTERSFTNRILIWSKWDLYSLAHQAILHSAESQIELLVTQGFALVDKDINTIISETGIPSGWYPMIAGYDSPPDIFTNFSIPEIVINSIVNHEQVKFSTTELRNFKNRLRFLYIAGRGATQNSKKDGNEEYGEEDSDAIGGLIPIPPETFIEELSQTLQVHPITIFWLLKEMREKEGLVCPSEQKRHVEDYVSVMILRMLGYQWPKQVEAREPLPDWADKDGIIPLIEGLGEPTLVDRIRKRFGADFGEEKEASIESEFANIVGKPLERWLEEDFFTRHVKQFKNRPIAWHIVSNSSVVNHEVGQSGKGKKKGGRKKQKPAFSVMVHYHRFVDGEKGYGKLLLLKNKYLEKLMSKTRSELESLRGKGDDPETFDRIAELDRKLVELEDFRERLERIQEGKDPESRIYVRWKSPEQQPRGWRPDINDGVKINIAPWERLGMFPIKKIVGKVEMAPQ
ncbi:MAG: hypothetical protein JRK26_20860 [Deltaproteobacteria bacterium]|nr:hypothetical protein [Deltaproteobacteria bacterium]